jgi:hypothetical protein
MLEEARDNRAGLRHLPFSNEDSVNLTRTRAANESNGRENCT